jgi:hypothetical protein
MAILTRAQVFQKMIQETLEFEATSPVWKALTKAGVTTADDFIMIGLEGIAKLTYLDSSDEEMIKQGHIGRLTTLHKWANGRSDPARWQEATMMSIMEDVYYKSPVEVESPQTTQVASGIPGFSPRATPNAPAAAFQKGIKRDIKDYPTFDDAKKYLL